MSITLTLPWPISTNAYWATRVIKKDGRTMAIPYLTHEAKAYKKQIAIAANVAGVGEPIRGRVSLNYQLYPARPLDWQKRQRKDGVFWDDTVRCLDLDNVQKVLFDGLKNIVFEDDSWIRKIIAERMEPDGGEARVVVTITAIQTEQPQKELL